VSLAYRCRYCEDPNRQPTWRLDRRGDGVVDWSCDQHLAATVEMLQRPWERTELIISAAARPAGGDCGLA
jgi:hypothetical protein